MSKHCAELPLFLAQGFSMLTRIPASYFGSPSSFCRLESRGENLSLNLIEILAHFADKFREQKLIFPMQLRSIQLRVKTLALAFAPIALSLLTHCSLIGGSGGLKRASNVSFSVPAHWQETDSNGESDRAFKLESGSTVTLTSSCQGSRKASLENLTKDLLLGARKIKFIKQERLNIANAEALFSHVNATVDGQAFQLLFVVTKKNNCVFDFSFVSPKSIPQREISEFLEFAKSFNYGQG